MSFDPRCYDLAEYFMPKNSAEHREALAEHIQQSIEDWLIGFRAPQTMEVCRKCHLPSHYTIHCNPGMKDFHHYVGEL